MSSRFNRRDVQNCPSLPAAPCPAIPAYGQCHRLSTYDHTFRLPDPHAVSKPISSTAYIDSCPSNNPGTDSLGNFSQLRVCGNADIECDLQINGNLQVTTIVSEGNTVVIDDSLHVIGTLSVCQIICEDGHLTLDDHVHITGTLEVCDIECETGTLDIHGTVRIVDNLDVCTVGCENGTVQFTSPISVNTIDTCYLFCSTGPVVTVDDELVVTGTLHACTIICDNGGVVINDSVRIVDTLFVCTILCAEPFRPVVIDDELRVTETIIAERDVRVLGTLYACTIDCTLGPITLDSSVVINGTLNVCTITCPGAGPVTVADTLVVNNDVRVLGTLYACTIDCTLPTPIIMDSSVQINGTLNVCSITCPGVGPLTITDSVAITGTLIAQSDVLVLGTLYACTIDCTLGGPIIMDSSVRINGTLEVCTIRCPGAGPVTIDDRLEVINTLTANSDLRVLGTLYACTIDCTLGGPITIDSSVNINGTLIVDTVETCSIICNTVMHLIGNTVEISGTLHVCTIQCPGAGPVTVEDRLVVNNTLTANSDVRVLGTLYACTIDCTLGGPITIDSSVNINGTLIVDTVETCSIICNTVMHLIGNTVEISGTLHVCTIQCPGAGPVTVEDRLVVNNTLTANSDVRVLGTLYACTIDCTLGGPITIDSSVNINGTLIVDTVETCSIICNTVMHLIGNTVEISGTLHVCTIQCPGAGPVTVEDRLVVNNTLTANSDVRVLGTLYACTIDCTLGPVTIDSSVVIQGTLTVPTLIAGTLVVTTLQTCTISCPGTLTFVTNTMVQNGTFILNGTIIADTVETCSIICSSILHLIGNTVDVSGTLQVCTIRCPGAGPVTIDDRLEVINTLTANSDVRVLGTLYACTIDCTLGAVNINGSVVIQGTLDVCTIRCPGAGPVTIDDRLEVINTLTANGDVRVLGTLYACTIDCTLGPVIIDSSVVIQGTLDVCTIRCPGAGPVTIDDRLVITGTITAERDLIVLGTLYACTIDCTLGPVTIDSSVVINGTLTVPTVIAGTMLVTTLLTCTIVCPGGGPLTIADTLVASFDVQVLGTLYACTIDCTLGPVTIDSSVVINGTLTVPTVIAGTMLVTTLLTCTIVCPGGGPLTIADTLVASFDVQVLGTLYACTIDCTIGPVQIPGGVSAGTIETCTIECGGTLNVFAPNVTIPGTVYVATLATCSILCSGDLYFYLPPGNTVHIPNLDVCAITCSGGTLILPLAIDLPLINQNVGVATIYGTPITNVSLYADVATVNLGPGGNTRSFMRITTDDERSGFWTNVGDNAVYQATQWRYSAIFSDTSNPTIFKSATTDPAGWTKLPFNTVTGDAIVGPGGNPLLALSGVGSAQHLAVPANYAQHYDNSGWVVEGRVALDNLPGVSDDAEIILMISTENALGNMNGGTNTFRVISGKTLKSLDLIIAPPFSVNIPMFFVGQANFPTGGGGGLGMWIKYSSDVGGDPASFVLGNNVRMRIWSVDI